MQKSRMHSRDIAEVLNVFFALRENQVPAQLSTQHNARCAEQNHSFGMKSAQTVTTQTRRMLVAMSRNTAVGLSVIANTAGTAIAISSANV